MFIEHVRQNICKGEDERFNWIMGYFAQLIQKPFERPLTTLVFKGKKGTGKNAFVDRIGKIIGDEYFKTAHNGRYLTSNFNGHLETCLCLVLDEAFWSGDKSAEGQLKGLTTADTIIIERKGMEPYSAKNYVRIVIIGNEDWLVPASADERRYAVFSVGEGRRLDGKFFEKMRILMDEKGGNEILLDFLKTFDLSKADVNTAPQTAELSAQKIKSLGPLDEFIFECIQEGSIGHHRIEKDARVSKTYFRDAYYAFRKNKGATKWNESADTIGRRFFGIFKNSVKTGRLKAEDGRGKCYILGDINDLRIEWDEHFGFKTEWDQD
jgi:hypothetical protein